MPFCRMHKENEKHNLRMKKYFLLKQMSPQNRKMPCKGKRVSLSASITVEACLVIPLFVFVFTIFCYILILLNFQVKVDKALYNTARTIAKYSYSFDAGEVMDAVAAGAMVISEVGVENIRNLGIVGGIAGFHFLFSGFENDMVDLVVQYNIKLPFSIVGNHYLPCTQRARTRNFVGVMPDAGSDEKNYVYVTETGSVYHNSLECTYLKLSIKEVLTPEAKQMLNQQEESYSSCEICTDGSYEPPYSYVTDYGNRYHFSINCSGLKRGIIKISVDEASSFKPCSRCGG